MSHVIAVATYGSNKVTNPKSKQRISAQKIGYTGGTAQVLLTLFGDKARDVSSQRASYKYIAFDANLNVHRGYILLRLDDKQLQQVADITRQHEHSRVFLWRDDKWLLFPTQRHDDYNTPLSGYPSFSPVGMQATSPTLGDKSAVVQGIQIEKSQRDSDRSPWWWVSGDTYAHRALLKQHGGRWSKKRKSWYFVGDKLPEAVQQLANDVNAHLADAGQTEDTQPDTEPPGSAHQNPSPSDEPPSSVQTETLSSVEPPDSAHAKTSSPQQSPSSAQLVDWVDGTRSFNQRYRTFTSTCHDNVHAIFARELVYEGEWINRREYVEIAFQQKLPMRRSEPDNRGQIVHWIGQRSVSVEEFDYLSFLQHQTKPCSLGEAASVLGLVAKPTPRVQDVTDAPDTSASSVHNLVYSDANVTDSVQNLSDNAESESDEAPHIRVIAPPELSADDPDAVQLAIQQVKSEPPTAVQAATIAHSAQRIPQEFCGELSGSITGQVYCYGYAIQNEVCTFLNMAGPRMAVEAMRARLGRGEIVNLVQWDGPSVELTAGDGETGKYTAFMQNIPEAKFTSMILVHQSITEPNYGGKSTTGIFHLSDAQAMAQLTQHVRELVNVPIFDAWTPYLWQAGQAAQLVRNSRGAGLPMKLLELDRDSWQRLIAGGLVSGVISLPSQG